MGLIDMVLSTSRIKYSSFYNAYIEDEDKFAIVAKYNVEKLYPFVNGALYDLPLIKIGIKRIKPTMQRTTYIRIFNIKEPEINIVGMFFNNILGYVLKDMPLEFTLDDSDNGAPYALCNIIKDYRRHIIYEYM